MVEWEGRTVLNKTEQQVIKIAADVVEMKNSKGFKEVFEPWLLSKLRESFPDPTQFKSDEEFIYAAKYASIYKKVIGEVLAFMTQHEENFQTLTQKKDKPAVRIGDMIPEVKGRVR